MGRSDDMLIVKGVNVFPSQIETVLLNKGYPANYQIIVSRERNSDKLEVQVEMTPEMFSDYGKPISRPSEKELVDALKAMLGIYANVQLVAPKSIARSEGKAVRIIDKRKLYDLTDPGPVAGISMRRWGDAGVGWLCARGPSRIRPGIPKYFQESGENCDCQADIRICGKQGR